MAGRRTGRRHGGAPTEWPPGSGASGARIVTFTEVGSNNDQKEWQGPEPSVSLFPVEARAPGCPADQLGVATDIGMRLVVAMKRRSSPTEDGEDLTEHLGGCLAPCWLGGPHSGQRDSGVDQQDKHTDAASDDQQYVDRKDRGEGSCGKGNVHEDDDAGG